MPKSRPNRPKKPPIEISSDESLITFSFSTPDRFKIGEKRGYPQTSSEKENQNQNQNQKPLKKTTKLMPFTANTPKISFPPLSPLSPEQYL